MGPSNILTALSPAKPSYPATLNVTTIVTTRVA
jgi:hypothetical protein